jgi:hypothetical protein
MNANERKAYADKMMQLIRTNINDDDLQKLISESNGASPELLARKALSLMDEGREYDLAHEIQDYVLRRMEDGRVMRATCGGSAMEIMDASFFVDLAAKDSHVFYQSYEARPGFAEWANELESTYFPAETSKNEDFEFLVCVIPPGSLHEPAGSEAVVFITIGVPFMWKEKAESLLDKHGLVARMEGAGVAGIMNATGVSMLLQVDPTAGYAIPEGTYVTPLRGKNIFQVVNKEGSPVYANSKPKSDT